VKAPALCTSCQSDQEQEPVYCGVQSQVSRFSSCPTGREPQTCPSRSGPQWVQTGRSPNRASRGLNSQVNSGASRRSAAPGSQFMGQRFAPHAGAHVTCQPSRHENQNSRACRVRHAWLRSEYHSFASGNVSPDMTPNPSVNATANGVPPGPRNTVAYRVSRGPGATPSSARYLKR
jgi:hypothetical protein